MNREEYIRFRDETALKRYKAVLPAMQAELKALSASCAELLTQYRMMCLLKDKHTADAFYANHCEEAFSRWAYLSAEVGEISRDIPRRVASLNALKKGQPETATAAAKPTDKLF